MPKRHQTRYPSDLPDRQWALIAPMIPDAMSCALLSFLTSLLGKRLGGALRGAG